MPRRALMERRPWLLLSLAAAIAYYLLKDGNFPGVYLYAIEAGAFLLLGAYALLRLGGHEGKPLAGVMVLAGIGSVAVELDSYIGALILLFSHTLALSILFQHPRAGLTMTQKYAGLALVVLTPLIAWLTVPDQTMRTMAVIYGLAVGGMAGAAWVSAFPRYRVGLGAVLVVAASLITILGAGLLAHNPLPGLVSWPLYYFGHFLLGTGIVQTLRQLPKKPELKLVA